MNLTRHFTVEEFQASEVAARHGIDNTLPTLLYPAAERVCEVVSEPARNALGPLRINSGYRCRAVNMLVGGAANSQHMRGQAVDLIPLALGVKTLDLLLWIYRYGTWDQLIWEFGGAWVHASYNHEGPQRREALAAVRGPDGRTAYAPLTDEQIKAL